MPWVFNVTKIERRERTIEAFGSLVFSGSYTAGGDATGSMVLGGGVGGWPQSAPDQSELHADRPPLSGTVMPDEGYAGVIVPAASGALPAKLKLYSAAGTELAAGAYPAAISGATQHTMSLVYRKLL